MNKTIENRAKWKVFVFLSVAFLSIGFIIFPRNAKAAPSISAYHMITNDTTPLIKGTSTELADDTVVSVSIGGLIYTSSISSGTWSVEFGGDGHPLVSGYYEATVTASTASTSAYIYVDTDSPYEFYYTGDGEEEFEVIEFSEVTFSEEYSYDSEDGNFSLLFPAGTKVTKTGDGTFDFAEWYAETADPNNERIILKLRFGIPDIDLTFSVHDVVITFHVGEEYNGQTLNIFSRGDGTNDEGWEPMEEINCNVEDGSCSFSISHASYFAVSEYNSIAETEEGMNNDDEDDSEKAEVDSWKAYQYENNNGVSCPNKLALEIKGGHFDKDAEVKIGGKKAYSVEKKSSEKLVAGFCMDKLLSIKKGLARKIYVINPDVDEETANKKIHLDKIGYNFKADNFDTSSVDGIKNIQQALSQLGFLDTQYVTGFYGPITTEAVRKFQKQNGLPTTGFVGPLTKAKLEEKIK